jgi:hypothetical protein
MEPFPKQQFRSPEEEIAFLKEEIARRERELLERNKNIDAHDIETVGREVVKHYTEHEPSQLLHKSHEMPAHELRGEIETVSMTSHQFDDLMRVMRERGIRNMLSVLEKLDNPFLEDEVHRELVEMLRAGSVIADLKEGMPLWNVLHMTLFEVALPRNKDEHHAKDLKTIFSAMEQFYHGMQTITGGKSPLHYTLEIAVSDKSDDIIFYVAVPNEFVNLFEKQALSLFPNAVLHVQQNDYNIFVDGGVSLVSRVGEAKHFAYPLKTSERFDTDPLSVLLNAFSKIEREGGGASVQFVIGGGSAKHQHTIEGIVKRLENGEKKDVAIRKSTFTGSMFEELKSFATATGKKPGEPEKPKEVDTEFVELLRKKLETPVCTTNIRIAASARTDVRADQILREIEASFHQFQDTKGNQLTFTRLTGAKKEKELHAFSFREQDESTSIPLSLQELTTIIHFPAEGIESSPQFKQSRAKHAPAPLDMPQHGLLLGENDFRNIKTKIYLTPEDRLRHLYVIGQTGTGKSGFLQSLVIQDIKEGAGVCMIDPHGKDVLEVLASVPPERMDDLIYFDPARMDRAIGLNMLEFDPKYPEQKTFVVNELFSMFQKLYGANPEALGPMFEQYFRNATQLVLEDPDTGSTLLDISRVMSDSLYRRMKLAKATNPVVVQFWTQIASKAGGESSLENIVPYITSKIDPLTANDFMRPIIGQQRSSFNFRNIIDTKKILLVNLSKGRLGEINANLIGMIIVGKLLMAALSRSDAIGTDFPAFHLYIDEFQNITTNSIASILSEARKYKLSLTVAHQFIAQLDERIRDAVFGNVGSMALFRVGSEDAQYLEKQVMPTFSANDLMNIENRNAYLRIISRGTPTPPFSMRTMDLSKPDLDYARELIEYSLLKFGTPREQIEADIRARYAM